jgi:hypothetical protein
VSDADINAYNPCDNSFLRGDADGHISVVKRNAHEDDTGIHISAFNYLTLSFRHEIPPKYYYNKSLLAFSLNVLHQVQIFCYFHDSTATVVLGLLNVWV